jgi:hypothetical protein
MHCNTELIFISSFASRFYYILLHINYSNEKRCHSASQQIIHIIQWEKIRIYGLLPMHLFYALYGIYCVLCIVLYMLKSMHYFK